MATPTTFEESGLRYSVERDAGGSMSITKRVHSNARLLSCVTLPVGAVPVIGEALGAKPATVAVANIQIDSEELRQVVDSALVEVKVEHVAEVSRLEAIIEEHEKANAELAENVKTLEGERKQLAADLAAALTKSGDGGEVVDLAAAKAAKESKPEKATTTRRKPSRPAPTKK